MWKATHKAVPFFNNRKPSGESLLEGFLRVHTTQKETHHEVSHIADGSSAIADRQRPR